MRVAIYARYSSDLQREASIEDQIRVCSERVRREGWSIIGQYTDRALSGASLSNRPGIKSLLADAKVDTFDLVGLEEDKAGCHVMMREFRRPKVIPPHQDMERQLRNQVARLDQVLYAMPEIQIEAGRILREIVSEVVLKPGNERGRMLIEVRGIQAR